MKKKGLHMLKKGKKRPRKSMESSPPTPTPPQAPELSLGQTSEVVEAEFQAALSRCHKDINIDFMITLNRLVGKGIVTDDRNNLLRTQKSCKQSWDCGMSLPIRHQDMFCLCTGYTKAMKAEVKAYMNHAARNHFFDAGDPTQRMDIMNHRGFFTIYPDPRPQKDPIFEKQPDLYKAVPLISLLAAAAVEYHNFMTGSKLDFKDVIQATMFFQELGQYYFITFKAFDNESSGEEVICQSRVLCHVDGNSGWPSMSEGPVPISSTYVESFHILDEN